MKAVVLGKEVETVVRYACLRAKNDLLFVAHLLGETS